MKKYICIFVLLFLLTACQANTDLTASNVPEETSSQTDFNIQQTPSATENSETEYPTEDLSAEEMPDSDTEEIMENSYPITGSALLDFCQFSFAENATLLSEIVAVVGEVSGYHTDSEPYFTLYDGTTITFEVNEEGYISNPYLTDVLNRKFEYLYSAETSYEFLNTEEIDRIKSGEYMPDHYSSPMSYGYVYYDRFLSISDFASNDLDLTKFGPPSGTAGSGMPWDYYQLADSSYYSYHFGQTFSPKFEVTGSKLNRIIINDYIDRTFIYKV